MLKSNRIITVDIGASKLALAEFVCGRHGAPQMMGYGIAPLGLAPEKETDPSAYIVSALRDLMREHNIKPAPVFMCISGQAVFPRFVKLPPVTGDKIQQIVQYEAEQNVPFPIHEVVWDYQLLGGQSEGELNVMLVAVKLDAVTVLTDCLEAVKMEPEVVDAAPMALYNALLFNYPGLEGCTLVLDIGARSSTLIFAENASRIFSRSVPIAGNTITAEIAKEFDVSFEEAEELKKRHGFVSLGGVNAGPDNETAERVSKIARNVTTRLHAEVNRSINFYRSQQGGTAPVRVLLTGGSAILPHTDTFFRDKLKVPVTYLNPFINVPVSPAISESRINADMHVLGELVGLALRHRTKCPVEISLMPPALVHRKAFRRRQPVFAATAAALVLTLLAMWGYSYSMGSMRQRQLKEVQERIGTLERIKESLDREKALTESARRKADTMADLIGSRTRWLEILDSLHSCLLPGMWITSVQAVVNEEGMATSLEINGRGFEDELKAMDKAGQATGVEQFRNNLQQAPGFTEKTEITKSPPLSAGGYARDFTLSVVLERPIKVW